MTDCAPSVYGPCAPYADPADVVACGACSTLDLEDPVTAKLVDDALLWASRRVFEATGGRWWGCCETTVAPCRSACLPSGAVPPPPDGGWPLRPYSELPAVPYGFLSDGETMFYNLWRCGCPRDGCSCGVVGDRVLLPFSPVRDVTEVVVDGVLLPPESYALDGASLIRLDGQRWPDCQATHLPPGSPGTWTVTFRHGVDPPPEAPSLVARFACELAKSCIPGTDCDLPNGFRVVERSGVEFGVMEPDTYREQGLTGYAPLDDWLLLLRGGPDRAIEPPRAYNPKIGA